MLITRKSYLSGVTHTLDLDVTPAQMNDYLHGGLLLQDAFPHLSAGDREFIKTGITSEEWDEMFGDPENEEESEWSEDPGSVFNKD
jgi:hypothetical protein